MCVCIVSCVIGNCDWSVIDMHLITISSNNEVTHMYKIFI